MFTMRCWASSTSFSLTLVVVSRSPLTVSAIRLDMLEKNRDFISSEAFLRANTTSLASQSRIKRCTERSSISRMFSNTNILSLMLWHRSGLVLSSSSKIRRSLLRSTLFMISATKSIPPRFMLSSLVIMVANLRFISSSTMAMASGDTLSILAMASTVGIRLVSGSCSSTLAACSASM